MNFSQFFSMEQGKSFQQMLLGKLGISMQADKAEHLGHM